VNGLDYLLGVISTECRAQVRNSPAHGFVGHNAPAPNRLNQLVVTQEFTGVIEKICEQSGDAGLQPRCILNPGEDMSVSPKHPLTESKRIRHASPTLE
jgi:hypothetical protein